MDSLFHPSGCELGGWYKELHIDCLSQPSQAASDPTATVHRAMHKLKLTFNSNWYYSHAFDHPDCHPTDLTESTSCLVLINVRRNLLVYALALTAIPRGSTGSADICINCLTKGMFRRALSAKFPPCMIRFCYVEVVSTSSIQSKLFARYC